MNALNIQWSGNQRYVQHLRKQMIPDAKKTDDILPYHPFDFSFQKTLSEAICRAYSGKNMVLRTAYEVGERVSDIFCSNEVNT